MDFGTRKAVSLGGSRSRGGKSKQELLDDSRRRRAERERVSAPGKAAALLTRHARGTLQRGRLARRLREALLCEAAGGGAAASALSLAQRLGWLHRMRARSADPELTETVATAILRAAAPLRDGRCACGGAPGSVGRAAWDRLVRFACPPLVEAAVAGGGHAARLLSLLLAPPPTSLPVCCAASAAADARRHLDSQAHRCIAALAAAVHAPHAALPAPLPASLPAPLPAWPPASAPPAAAPLVLASLTRAVLRIDSTPPGSGALGRLSAAEARPSDESPAEAPPELFSAFVRALWPPMLVSRPPPVGVGREALREAVRGWGREARARLVGCVADGLAGWQAEGVLATGAMRYEASALLVQLLFTCAAGQGCDWRAGGWTEASPRLLSPLELAPLPRAVASRLAESLAAGGGQGEVSSGPRVAAGGADAALALVRSGWHVGPAAEELRTEFGQDAEGGTAEGGEAFDGCGICFDPPSPSLELACLGCGHRFCKGCWGGMMAEAVASGPGCVHAKCPQPGCARRLTGSLWERCVPPGAPAETWRRVCLRSFVRAHPRLCFCPSSHCETAAGLVSETTPDVACHCGARFCGLCGDEAHFPASCSESREWARLLHVTPDAHFLMLNTRPCPSCGARTQRDKGCMHISCPNCAAEWCWACGQTGGRGEVHHVRECARVPDASWAFEKEQARVVDGSFAGALDAAAYRAEIAEMLLAPHEAPPLLRLHASPPPQHDPPHPRDASPTQPPRPPSSSGSPPSPPSDSLRPTLALAMHTLRWAHVYTYFNAHRGSASVPPSVRLSLAQLERHADWLLAHAGLMGEQQGSAEQDGSKAGADAHADWLVACLLFLRSNLERSAAADKA